LETIDYFEKTFEVYITKAELEKTVQRIAGEINQFYAHVKEPIIFISILDGSFMFMADLIRAISIDVEIEFVKLKSYDGTSSRGEVAHYLKVARSLKGKHILVVEDIIDTGLTIDVFLEELRKKEAADIKVCALLSKPEVHNDIIDIDFTGKEIGPEFVIGYGLDIDGLGRNLPDIYKLKL